LKGSELVLKILDHYKVKYVFGLPGETTLPLYFEWATGAYEVRHVMLRDERNACFAADGYARVSYSPGVCEAPSSGAAHVIPSVVEAYASSLPMIYITTDVPLHLEKKNMLTGFNQTAIFSGIVKESHTVLRARDIPFVFKRAFRVATSGRPGPVHIRIPIDVLEEEDRDILPKDLEPQQEFIKYPGHRFAADEDKILKAIDLLLSSERPVIVCGQGALYSQAWEEIIELAEMLGIPVGSTITGKGCFPENHPLSIGVIGARGGTSFSNSILRGADLVFYIGSNVDYAATDNWSLPLPGTKVIHLDISEVEVGNNIRIDVGLIGDAKATLRRMIDILRKRIHMKITRDAYKDLQARRGSYEKYLEEHIVSREYPVNPLRVVKALEKMLPKNYIIVCDPGVGAIYTSAFFRISEPGRKILFNYSIGSLGYSLPAAIGAWYANQDATVLSLMGDGSFGFVAGELESLARLEANVKILLFNNQSYGWMRATTLFSYGPRYFETEFKHIDYVKIAEGFGIYVARIEGPDEVEPKIRELIKSRGPMLLEIPVVPEDKLVPPVPLWAEKAKTLGIRYIY